MLKDNIFLTNTDTTIGFVSQNRKKLNQIKKRPLNKEYIKVYNSYSRVLQDIRIPSHHKKLVRRANKTTFITPKSISFRVVKEPKHLLLLNRLGGWAYSTSANISNQNYNENYARASADIIIEPLNAPKRASTIYKLGKKKIKKIR